MRRSALSILTAVLASSVLAFSPLAQTTAPANPQQPSGPAQAPAANQERPSDLTVAPNAPPTSASSAAVIQTSSSANSSGPQIICQELVAYLRAKRQTPAAPGTQQGMQASAPQGPQSERQAPQQAAPAQQREGQSTRGPGQADAPSPTDTQGSSGMTRPIPNTRADQQRSPVTLQEATVMLDQNQLLACRDAAQHMRRSGVAMPPALIALAAFPRERFQRSPEPASPAQDQTPR